MLPQTDLESGANNKLTQLKAWQVNYVTNVDSRIWDM